MKTIEQIGKPGVALLNPFRGAFHGGAKVFLSETETRKNHGIRRQRTTEKEHPGMRWRHRKRCVWRHVRTFEPRKKQESGTNFPPSLTANRPEGYLTIATLYRHLAKNSIFGRGRISKKGHRKSVASRHRQHHTQGTFPGTHAPYALRDAKLQHSARTNRNPYQKHTATHPLCQTQSHPQASP